MNVRVPDPTTTVALPVDDHTSETSGIEESDIHSTPEGVSYMDRRRSMGWCSSSDIVESSRSGSSLTWPPMAFRKDLAVGDSDLASEMRRGSAEACVGTSSRIPPCPVPQSGRVGGLNMSLVPASGDDADSPRRWPGSLVPGPPRRRPRADDPGSSSR